MKYTFKLVIKYILYGISIGCTFFVMMCLSYSLWGWKDKLMLIYMDFSRQSIGAMIIGIACGSTAIVYQFDRLSYVFGTIIHFCVGMGVFYPLAIYLGWIPFYPDRIFINILHFLCSCGIFMAIQSCFYLFNRNEAKRINKRLREFEQEHNSNKE